MSSLKREINPPVTQLVYNKTTDTSTIKHVMLVHDRVENYQVFVENANSNTFPIVYNSYSSTKELLSVLHSKFTIIDRIAFVFHGGKQIIQKKFLDGQLMFTTEDIATPAPAEYSQNVQFIINIFNTFQVKYADFLACDSLLFDDWKSYYDVLESKTTTIIGASNNDTGNLYYGADWIMETTEQDVRDLYFNSSISQYQILLAKSVYTNTDNVQYQYDPDTGTDASVYDGYNASGSITLLSQFVVGGVTYNVTSISMSAFYANSNITSVTISNTITTIGQDPFTYCSNIQSFAVIPGGVNSFVALANDDFDGVLYDSTYKTCYAYPSASSVTSYNIESTTETIVSSAFSVTTYLNTISIGASVTTIEDDAIFYCYSLQTINVDSSNTNYSSDNDGVLYNKNQTTLILLPIATQLTSYNVPTGVTTLLRNSIVPSHSLTSITFPSTLTTIEGNNLFSFSGSSIVIPFNVTSIGSSFLYASAVTSLLFENPNNITYLDGYFAASLKNPLNVTYQYTANAAALNPVISGADFIYDSTTTTFIYDANCFNKGTKILCLNNNFKDEYIAVENLKKGDMVKSYKHGYRAVADIVSGTFKNNPVSYLSSMYKMTKTEENGLLEDLIITGGHAILVDELTAEQEEKNLKMYNNCKFKVDDKIMLLAGATNDFKVLEDNDTYTYYHFYLENDGDDTQRFGVWANNLLVETPNKEYFTKHMQNK